MDIRIVETKKMVGNWEEYTGRYNVIVDGELYNDEPVSKAEADKIKAQLEAASGNQ